MIEERPGGQGSGQDEDRSRGRLPESGSRPPIPAQPASRGRFMWLAFVLILAVVAIAAYAFRLPGEFRIVVRGGRVAKTSGNAPIQFVQEVDDIVNRAGVDRGTIRAERAEGRMRFHFSPSIPESCRQRIRNVWGTHR